MENSPAGQASQATHDLRKQLAAMLTIADSDVRCGVLDAQARPHEVQPLGGRRRRGMDQICFGQRICLRGRAIANSLGFRWRRGRRGGWPLA